MSKTAKKQKETGKEKTASIAALETANNEQMSRVLSIAIHIGMAQLETLAEVDPSSGDHDPLYLAAVYADLMGRVHSAIRLKREIEAEMKAGQ